MRFLPTPSTRRATRSPSLMVVMFAFLPTPSTRRATYAFFVPNRLLWISTHALHEEGDRATRSSSANGFEFLPTPSTRRATRYDRQCTNFDGFLPTPSTRRATQNCNLFPLDRHKFLPTPSTRRATGSAVLQPPPLFDFYPRPPRGGRHGNGSLPTAPDTHFYPRPPRGGRPDSDSRLKAHVHISTHALHEEGDLPHGQLQRQHQISTHALHEEGDQQQPDDPLAPQLFLPTPSTRRATKPPPRNPAASWKFLPTPSTRRATALKLRRAMDDVFLPTPSTRRATVMGDGGRAHGNISTHALHEEGDYRPLVFPIHPLDFYPRPPRGGRPTRTFTLCFLSIFLPTPSTRRATRSWGLWV